LCLRLAGSLVVSPLVGIAKIGIANEQCLDLPHEFARAEGLDEQGIGMVGAAGPIRPILVGGRKSREQSGGRRIVLTVRGANYFKTRLFGFHAKIADHHVINARIHASERLGRAFRNFHFEIVQLKDSFQREQDGEIVIDEKNASFHLHFAPLNFIEMQSRELAAA
jgi:hypothetical protein